MQNCLQKKSLSKRFAAGALVLTVFFAVTGAMLACGENQHETTTFSAKHGKYLSVMNVNEPKAVEQNRSHKAEDTAEMNNFNDENAKNGILTDEAKAVTRRTGTAFPESVTVYFHESGEYKDLELEEYVVGCVLAEMPSGFDTQALMAQAVAVRSFTCSKLLQELLSSHPKAAVCTDYRHCQSYISPSEYEKKGDYAVQAVNKIREAVCATRGICAFYENEPIVAVYHASSGVRTKSSSEVWGGDVPYLVSVKAAEDKGACSFEYTYSYDQAEQRLSGKDGEVKCFSVLGRDISCSTDSDGLITSMSFSGKVFDKYELQQAFSMRSDDFSAVLTDDGITFTSYGYGHGVGMSQYGANALAEKGYGFMDILKYYYNGIGFSYIY